MQFEPAQIVLGAVIGLVPSLLLVYVDGRRARADRLRTERLGSLDAAVGRLNKLLDHAAAELASDNTRRIPGVLPHDQLGFYQADVLLIPDQASVREFTLLVKEVIMDGLHRDDRDGTARRLGDLFVAMSTSAAARRVELVSG